MKIVISSGHCKYVRGASGYLDEVDEARLVVEKIADFLQQAGVDVVTFHDDTSHDQSTNLSTIVAFHNGQGPHDLDVSVHFNAYDGSAHGTECLYVSQAPLADKVARAIADAGGFTNRGAKQRGDLYFLNNTSEPAILIEVCFVDNRTDAELYGEYFDEICQAIAESISGESIEAPPDRPDRPPDVTPPPPISTRPTGDHGYHVETVQRCLELEIDGDFGRQTEEAVKRFQSSQFLEADGIVGPCTWSALELVYHLPPYPPHLPPPLDQSIVEQNCQLAIASPVAGYPWDDRGVAPPGFTMGMAIAWSTVLRKYIAGDPAALEMGKGNTWNSETDVLAWYEDEFYDAGLGNNSEAGIDTLRHLFVLLIGLGMRESSGMHCCGRDMSPITSPLTLPRPAGIRRHGTSAPARI